MHDVETITFRPGVPADALEVARLFAKARAQMTCLPQLHTEAEDIDFLRGQLESSRSLLAVQQGELAGFAIYDEEFLHHLYVHPDRQNRSVGSQLLRRVQGLVQGEQLQLWVFQSNTSARRFYERHGFVALELTDGSGNEERMPDARYEWRARRG